MTTDDVTTLIQAIEAAYQAGARAPRLGIDRSTEIWGLAVERPASASIVNESQRLVSEIEYLDRAANRSEGRRTQVAYQLATERLLEELDRLGRSASPPRALPAMECLRLRMESPLAVVLGIPDAFVAIGGVSGLGAFLALLEKQANVLGRIKLEHDMLRLKQTQVAFERERLEAEQRLWRDAFESVAPAPTKTTDYSTVALDLPFDLRRGVLESLESAARPTELE